jgi:hypothetical protein
MLPKAVHRFEEWFEAPLSEEAGDSHFEVRRAHPSEFERHYDLVNEAFGVKRPRAVFDWLYRENPTGVAHCWAVEERATGRLVCQGTYWPWPMARGMEPRLGYLAGDLAVAPDKRHQGLAELRRRACDSDPLHPAAMKLGWPNDKTISRFRKHGRLPELAGSMLEGGFRMRRRRPRAWTKLRDRLRWRSLRVEELTRFDSGFDALTRRTMAWKGFWFPHDAEFLNWRYLAHPTRSYRALAVLDGDEPAGYCVVRTDGRAALLMEFAAPEASSAARLLLQRAHDAAREAGCQQLSFFAPPGWRHWPLFRAAGCAPRGSDRYVNVRGTPDPEAYRIEGWQIVPGDNDDA